jgi:hypothetical protein
MKGIAALVGSGTVEDRPEAVAAFLREHVRALDRWGTGCRLHLPMETPVRTPGACMHACMRRRAETGLA